MKKAEFIIKEYFRKKRNLDILLLKLETQERKIEKIKRDISECNINMEVTISSINYTREKVQGGTYISSIERELERSIDILIEALKNEIKTKIKLESRIRNLESDLMNIEVILNELKEEEERLIHLIYKDNKTYRYIEHEMNMSMGTITNTKKRILNKLGDLLVSS